MDKEQLESQLGFILTEIDNASEEEKPAVEAQYEQEIQSILQQLSEIENG